jgi:prepilin-type N-terminal cleavage/methylation domain-containing protein
VKALSIGDLQRGRSARASAGFTLIELAVVVFIVSLILGGILVPLTSQVAQRQISDAQRQLEDIKEAIVGFALANGYLPCPDITAAGTGTPNDGREDVITATGFCESAEGNVPWATLGLSPTDPWGNRYRYRVTDAYAQRAPAAAFGLDTQGSMRLCTDNSCANLLTIVPPNRNSAVAVVLSHGPNGWGSINADTDALQLPPGCAAVTGCADIGNDEQANANGDATFVSRPQSPRESTLGQFDDIVIWLSPHTLKHRMVAAGKLP